jgi:hypothetical protein
MLSVEIFNWNVTIAAGIAPERKYNSPGAVRYPLRFTTARVPARPIGSFMTMATFRALEGDNLQRWRDPRLSRLAVEPVSCAVFFYSVAVHRELPGTR